MKRFGMVVLMGMALGINVQAQTKTEGIVRQAILTTGQRRFDVVHDRKINLATNDTTEVMFMAFQNREYDNITDIKYLWFRNQSELNQFVADIRSAYLQMTTDSEVELTWRRSEYRLSLYADGRNVLMISADDGYTFLPAQSVNRLIGMLSGMTYSARNALCGACR